jgi:hypothetical protein
MDWWVTREAIITLAVLGAIASVAATVLRSSGRIGAGRAQQLNTAGYGLMAVSILLFIVVGFKS